MIIIISLNCFKTSNGAGGISRIIANQTNSRTSKPKEVFGLIGQQLDLKCDCKIDNSTTTIKWQRLLDDDFDRLLEKHELEISENGSILRITRLSNGVKGYYICELHLDTLCKNTFNVEVKLPPQNGLPLGETIGIVFTVVVITLLGVGLCFELLRRRNRHGLSRKDIELFEKGNKDGYASGKYAHENVMLVPYDQTYEIPETKLKLNKDSVLGAGAFGIVFTAELDGKTVAVKSVKAGADKTYLKALLTELKVMIYVGRHPNIAELVGACSKDLGRGILYVVVTVYELGNIENFIRGRRYTFQNLFTETGRLLHPNSATNISLHKSPIDDNLTTMDLLRWAIQVASAMEYLSNRNVIHGDLATRNVLLDSNRNAKVTDFGLARQIYEYSNYVKQSHEPLPWRSMAIESLRRLEFSTESDIWSYGVFLWELFTCGDVPYPNHNWSQGFVDKLEAGLRLHRPKYSTKDLYKEVILRCFEQQPQNRIKYPAIKQYLESVQPSLRKMSSESDGLSYS